MTQYVESSAVLAWLLGEVRGAPVPDLLVGADTIVTSQLTPMEIDRALHRYVAVGALDRATAAVLGERVDELTAGWAIEPISQAVVDRARAPFPDDAIRSLDAIHLATALVIRAAVGEVDVLSLDERIRRNAAAMGFRVVPD